MKYKIKFYYNNGMTETYSGGTFVLQGEKYAVFDCMNPKLYKSKKIAENSAKRLINSCVNTSSNYEVVEVNEVI